VKSSDITKATQRRGLPGGFREPMFVVGIRPDDRAVVIGPREQLLGRGLVVREVNWLVDPIAVGAQLAVQIRHRATPAAATMIRRSGDEVELALEDPVAAITPGQSAVFYDGERVLGGGVIERASGQRSSLPVLAA
jgi:tRNA-specific 2-thiouridylase